MKTTKVLLLGWGILVCCSLASEDTAAPPAHSKDGWKVSEHAFGRIHFKDGSQKDADKVAGYFKEAVKQLTKAFSAHDPEKILSGLDCAVFLHPEPTENASEGVCTALTNYNEDRGKVELHFLTPSKYDPEHQTSAGEPKDEHTFFKYVVHEYSTLLIEGLERSKKSGWRASPVWFTQGYEEYLALTCSSEHARTVSLPKYIEIVKSDPGRVDFSFGVDVKDPYIDGAVLVAFMHDCFGKDRVQNILCSTEPTFGAALRKELGVKLNDFAKKWSAWLSKK